MNCRTMGKNLSYPFIDSTEHQIANRPKARGPGRV